MVSLAQICELKSSFITVNSVVGEKHFCQSRLAEVLMKIDHVPLDFVRLLIVTAVNLFAKPSMRLKEHCHFEATTAP